MDVPGIVQDELDGENVAASVSLGSEDALFVTPTRTLIYRSDGILSDESVESYPHDTERVTLNEGRRKTRITLDYSIDGERDFAVPSSVASDVLHPVLAGILNGTGVTNPGETVVQTFLFSELTLIITSERLAKHVGSAVWDADHDQYHFEDVTRLEFEDGSVATQVILEVDGRPQRIKVPNEHIAVVRERLEQALFAYYDVDSLEELNELGESEADTDDEPTGGTVDFGEGVDPLGADSGSDRPADTSNGTLLDDDTDPLVGDPTTTDDAPDDATADGSDPRRPVSGDATDTTPDRGATTDATSETTSASTDADGRRATSNASADHPAADSPPADSDSTGSNHGRSDPADSSPADADTDRSTTLDTAGASDATDATASTSTDDSADAEDESEFEAAGFQPATTTGDDIEELHDRIDDLEARIDTQSDLLERQQSLLEQLIEELKDR